MEVWMRGSCLIGMGEGEELQVPIPCLSVRGGKRLRKLLTVRRGVMMTSSEEETTGIETTPIQEVEVTEMIEIATEMIEPLAVALEEAHTPGHTRDRGPPHHEEIDTGTETIEAEGNGVPLHTMTAIPASGGE